MNIEFNAPGMDYSEEKIKQEIDKHVGRFSERLTRIEVYLRDENGDKGGIDTRCTLEARPRGLDPVTAEHLSDKVDTAVTGALGKLQRVLDKRFERLNDHR